MLEKRIFKKVQSFNVRSVVGEESQSPEKDRGPFEIRIFVAHQHDKMTFLPLLACALNWIQDVAHIDQNMYKIRCIDRLPICSNRFASQPTYKKSVRLIC